MIKIKGVTWITALILLITTGCTQAINAVQPETSESSIVIDDSINREDEIIRKIIEGNWLISEYVESAQLLDLTPLPEDYNSHLDGNVNSVIGGNILFNDNTVVKYSAPSELGFVYEDVQELYFGYKVPLELESPIVYVCIQHSDFDNSVNFIQDGVNNTYLEIDYNYYKVEKLPESNVMMYLPVQFVIMPDRLKRVNYPSVRGWRNQGHGSSISDGFKKHESFHKNQKSSRCEYESGKRNDLF